MTGYLVVASIWGRRRGLYPEDILDDISLQVHRHPLDQSLGKLN